MRFSATLAALAASLSLTNAFNQGFNMAANNPDGSCLTTAQYATAFKRLKALPQQFTNVRLYASSDCNQLALAVPAAIQNGMKILVGVWTEDATHYNNEKQALLSAIEQHGHDWILAVSVGSEDLYRGDTTASTLAGQVYDVRGMIRAQGANQMVGHVDTWTAWVNSANAAVITAVDFLGMDGYPYFQNSAISDAENVFFTSLSNTKAVAKGKPVWVTETGWPVSGPSSGAAVPSVANAKYYFHHVYCKAATQASVFWYVYQDYSSSPSFGIFNSAGKAIYDLEAC